MSVALALVYFFDWPFPKELKLLNYDIPLSAVSIEVLAWAFLIYLCIEYVVHLRSKFPEITTKRREYLMEVLSPYVWKNLEKNIKDDIESHRKKSLGNYVLDQLKLDFTYLDAGVLKLHATPYFRSKPGHHPSRAKGAGMDRQLPYSRIRRYRLWVWTRFLFTEGLGFEYVLPAIYPAVALLLMIFQKLPAFPASAKSVLLDFFS